MYFGVPSLFWVDGQSGGHCRNGTLFCWASHFDLLRELLVSLALVFSLIMTLATIGEIAMERLRKSVFEHLFPSTEVRAALQSMDQLERKLPRDVPLGPYFGFSVIKDQLREVITRNGDMLRKQSHVHPIETLVVIVARNLAWEELASGMHTVGTRKMITGDGLAALYDHLTDLLEKAGVETDEEAKQCKACLRDMIKKRFGP
jgi:hypothetical protein